MNIDFFAIDPEEMRLPVQHHGYTLLCDELRMPIDHVEYPSQRAYQLFLRP
ncbi:MAG: hypothetical protein AAFS10_25350 [Myxococcota bacterium]